jgi:acyl-coenzyme A synthetase/AMP-(fatty) acid ligase
MFGERVVGYVVAADKAHLDPTQLQAHCRSELASYKIPRKIEVCDMLPTNFLGKVRRVELRTHAVESPEKEVSDGDTEELCPKQ